MPIGQKISEQTWHEHKAEIEALYIGKDHSLEKVMTLMRERYAFIARLGT